MHLLRCNTRITKNHGVEQPYIESVAKEWQLYKGLLPEQPIIKEIHLGGGTPTFFSPQHLEKLIVDVLNDCEVHPNAEELEKDELLVIEKNEVRVTNAGKRFLRNICLAFDRRYWAKEVAGQVFSSGA